MSKRKNYDYLPDLDCMNIKFIQEGNTNDTTSETESITIDLESSLGIDRDEGFFFVLKTDGWSFDSIEEFSELLKRVEKMVNFKKKGK